MRRPPTRARRTDAGSARRRQLSDEVSAIGVSGAGVEAASVFRVRRADVLRGLVAVFFGAALRAVVFGAALRAVFAGAFFAVALLRVVAAFFGALRAALLRAVFAGAFFAVVLRAVFAAAFFAGAFFAVVLRAVFAAAFFGAAFLAAVFLAGAFFAVALRVAVFALLLRAGAFAAAFFAVLRAPARTARACARGCSVEVSSVLTSENSLCVCFSLSRAA